MNKVKISLVGQENVGKTCLASTLKLYFQHGPKKFKKCMRPEDTDTASTNGIAIDSVCLERPPDTPKGAAARSFFSDPVQLNLWDFSGAESFYQSHSLFLSDHSIYLVLWKITSEAETSRVPFWMETIKHHAPNSPVFLVATNLDAIKRKKHEKLQQTKEMVMEKYKPLYPNLVDVFGLSSTTGSKVSAFAKALELTIRKMNVLFNQPTYYPTFYTALKRLQSHKIDNIQKGPPILEWDLVQKVFDKCQIPQDKTNETLQYFENIGELMYVRGSESSSSKSTVTGGWQLSEKQPGFIAVEPQWIVQLFASVLSNRHVKNGVITRKILETFIWTPPLIPKEIHDQLIRVLVSFEIVYYIKLTDTLLIPSLLENKPENFQSKWPVYDPTCFQYTRFYDFQFFPASLFPKFLVQIFQLNYGYDVWSTGLFLSHELILCLIEKTENRISITVRAPELDRTVATFFTSVYEILEALLKIERIDKVEISSPCPLCISAQLSTPTLFTKSEIEKPVSILKQTLTCKRLASKIHTVPLFTIVPDLKTIDFDAKHVDLDTLSFTEVIQDTIYMTRYKGVWNEEAVAVKVLKFPKGTKGSSVIDMTAQLRSEVQIMCRFDHPCIVPVKAHSLTDVPGLVTEYYETTLQSHLKQKEMDWPLRLRVLYDILSAFHFLHNASPPVIFSSFKPTSIVIVSDTPTAKVCAKIYDFSMAREFDANKLKVEFSKIKDHDFQSVSWSAPEILKDGSVSLESDTFNIGTLLWALFTKETPWEEYGKASEVEAALLEGKRLEIPSSCPERYSELIKKCWAAEPSSRPALISIIDEIMFMVRDLAPPIERTLKTLHLYVKNSKAKDGTGTPSKKKLLRSRSQYSYSKRNSEKDTKYYSTSEKLEMGFIPSTSNSLVDKWKGKFKPGGYEPVLVEIAEKIFFCPFPGNLENPKHLELELETLPEYKIYNLSSETYDYAIFQGVVVEYKIEGKEAPPLKVLQTCVDDINTWLHQYLEETTVALIHGSGKCRGPVIVLAAWLMKIKKFSSLEAVLMHLKTKIPNFPVLHPSQKRYLQYYIESLQNEPIPKTVYLHKLRFITIPNYKFTGGCEPIYCVQQEGRTIFFSKKMKGRKDKDTVEFFCRDINVSGDIKIEFFHKSSAHKMFSLTLNTDFENKSKESKLVFERNDLDIAWKESSKKHFHTGFKFEVYFLSPEQHRDMNKKMQSASVVEETTAEKRKRMGKTKRPSSRLVKSFFPKKEEIDTHDSDSSQIEPETCYICKKYILVASGQNSIGILPGVTVHYDCLECADCGASLKDKSLETVVKSDRIICNNCEKEIFPICSVCTKIIKTNEFATLNYNFWHPECLPCSLCKTHITGTKFRISDQDNKPFCSVCSEKMNIVQVAVHEPTEQEEELEQLLGEVVGRKYFRLHLEDNKAQHWLSFWEKVSERKEEAKDGRVTKGEELIKEFLQESGPHALPSSLVGNVPIPANLETMEAFDNLQKVVFWEMAKTYIPNWVDSIHYVSYISDLVGDQDQETKEDDIRRAAAKTFIPIQQEDLLCQAMVILDLDANMELIEVNLSTGEKEKVKGEQPDDLIAVVFAEANAAASKAREIAEMVDKRRAEATQLSRDKSLAALDQMLENQISSAFSGAELELKKRRAPPSVKKANHDLDNELNAAILQAFGGKNAQANINKDQPNQPPAPANTANTDKVSAAKRKMAELWVNGSLQQAKFSYEVAETCRKAVETSFEVMNRAVTLVNQENISLEIADKAIARINREIEVIQSETTKAQNTIIVVQKADKEAKANGPDFPQTKQIAQFVDKVVEEVRVCVKIASECPKILEEASTIVEERKAIAMLLNES